MAEPDTKPAAAYFVVQSGPDKGKQAVVDPQRPAFVIGSDPRSSLHLADPSLSPSHAVVSTQNGAYIIRPRHAHNEVHVNGQPVRDLMALKPGDTLRIGDTSLSFRYDADYVANTSIQALAPASAPKPAVLPRYVPASRYAAPSRALQAAPTAMTISYLGERAIYYPKPAEKPPNVMALMAGYLSILAVIGLFAYALVMRLSPAPTANFYGEFAPGTVRILAFYADW